MRDYGTMQMLVNNLVMTMNNKDFKEMYPMIGMALGVDGGLMKTVTVIKEMIANAEAKGDSSGNVSRLLFEEIKDAVYEADDFFDKLLALAQPRYKPGKLFNFSPVRHFNMLPQLQAIRQRLDGIVDNHAQFDIYMPTLSIKKNTREESRDYVRPSDIIGREDDVIALVELLLGGMGDDPVAFLTIVGVGGLGKTALAQLVFQDPRIVAEFPLRLWVCVSDINGGHFDVRLTLVKILQSATGQEYDVEFENVLSLFKKELQGKKFLLILDDVWNENRNEFLQLRSFLMLAAEGSRVVVTSRLKDAARTICHSMYELNCLSQENSWRLFAMCAFSARSEMDSELVAIGKKILKHCSNVPLAIRVLGSLLYGQEKDKWLSFLECGFAEVFTDDSKIMATLKLSYDSLPVPLRSCFKFCALFPKEHELAKEKLTRMWMAQGYIVPLWERQSIEDAAEHYFLYLVQRCFFQDIKRDAYGEIFSCKMNRLMHDFAQSVAGTEICIVNHLTAILPEGVRHRFHSFAADTRYNESSFTKTRIRTYLQSHCNHQFPVDVLMANWRCLRVLDLHFINIENLPVSIGKLVHLRYLDLSHNELLTMLPGSVTKLYNLQTLDLRCCPKLKELPTDLSKLVNLRHLDIYKCGLTCMPANMDRLTSLCVLTRFVVASGSFGKQRFGQLGDLTALTNLKSSIVISIPGNVKPLARRSEGGYLRSMVHLKEMQIHFMINSSPAVNSETGVIHEVLLEKLQPHPNLRGFILLGYQGVTLGSLGKIWAICLPNLVKLKLSCCERLQHLPLLSQLRHLKSLILQKLMNLEYIENADITGSSTASFLSGSRAVKSIFFPSLECLEIQGLPKLKGWWEDTSLPQRQLGNSSCNRESFFPHLYNLSIKNCPNLISFPHCPSVQTLCLSRINESLQVAMGKVGTEFASSSLSSSSTWPNSHVALRELEIDNVGFLKSLPTGCLVSIHINCAQELESLSDVRESFKNCPNLRELKIENCSNLSRLSTGLEHLTALKSLSFCSNPNLTLEDDDNDGTSWRSLSQTLHSLELVDVENMMILPNGMQFLTTLHNLTIHSCRNLTALPAWISSLSSLESLHIISCLELSEGCRQPDGTEWYKIQHIPLIHIHE